MYLSLFNQCHEETVDRIFESAYTPSSEGSPDEGVLVFMVEEIWRNVATSGSVLRLEIPQKQEVVGAGWELSVRVEVENFPSGSLRGCHSLT